MPHESWFSQRSKTKLFTVHSTATTTLPYRDLPETQGLTHLLPPEKTSVAPQLTHSEIPAYQLFKVFQDPTLCILSNIRSSPQHLNSQFNTTRAPASPQCEGGHTPPPCLALPLPLLLPSSHPPKSPAQLLTSPCSLPLPLLLCRAPAPLSGTVSVTLHCRSVVMATASAT